jgi:site-specific recombinase
LEEYPRENQLIFKLQQRKSSKIKQLAENVVSQLSPDWRDSVDSVAEAEDQFLRRELARYFKVSKDCRLIEDHTTFRVTADKKVALQVLAIRNLPKRGTCR